jgi:hypothetical protein
MDVASNSERYAIRIIVTLGHKGVNDTAKALSEVLMTLQNSFKFQVFNFF